MALPTRLQVQTRFLAFVDDVNGATFTDAVFDAAFGEAYDALYQAFLTRQVPRIRVISTYTLPAVTTSLTPTTAGWTNFADFEQLEERLSGSTDNYTQLTEWDNLPQRVAVDRLLDFVWRNNTFYFVGATAVRQLRVTYESSGEAPTADADVIGVDGSLTFLARASVAAIGAVKGYDELAAANRLIAYGPAHDRGELGGELYRLISPLVRERQHVRIAPKPFTLSRGFGRRRAIPYVAAQQPAGVGTAPAQFSSALSTITGTIDGLNATFYLSYPVTSANVYRNGILLTNTVDYTFAANQIVFVTGQIPAVGDIITVEGWI